MTDREYLLQQLNQRYETVKPVGRNKVLYRHRETGAELLVLTLPAGSDLTAYRRLAGRTHPNLVTVYDVIDDEASPTVLREYLPGQSLDQLLQRDPPDPRRVRRLALDICDGLIALHSLQIVHKDLKPENIIITPDGTARLIDYGIATVFGADRPSETALLGTIGFAAPEQFGFNRTDGRTDLYAFGVLLNVLLTHEHPTVRQYRQGSMGRVIRKCLVTNPDGRYPSAVALRRDLL